MCACICVYVHVSVYMCVFEEDVSVKEEYR